MRSRNPCDRERLVKRNDLAFLVALSLLACTLATLAYAMTGAH